MRQIYDGRIRVGLLAPAKSPPVGTVDVVVRRSDDVMHLIWRPASEEADAPLVDVTIDDREAFRAWLLKPDGHPFTTGPLTWSSADQYSLMTISLPDVDLVGVFPVSARGYLIRLCVI